MSCYLKRFVTVVFSSNLNLGAWIVLLFLELLLFTLFVYLVFFNDEEALIKKEHYSKPKD